MRLAHFMHSLEFEEELLLLDFPEPQHYYWRSCCYCCWTNYCC